ncbi:MAG TPA: hypothetical protein VI603_19040 [Saprospiraceae bacterium]|nr:hypothetical protein [Saprospiraceae bacterium]
MRKKIFSQSYCLIFFVIAAFLSCADNSRATYKEGQKRELIQLLNPSWRSVTEYPEWHENFDDNWYDECVLEANVVNVSGDSLKIAVVAGKAIYSDISRQYYKDGRARGRISDGLIDEYLNVPINDTINVYVGVYECKDTSALDSIVLMTHLHCVGVDTVIMARIILN